MILLANVKITNVPLYRPPYRGHLGLKYKRLEIWKYTLASYVPVLPLISKVILYIDLATTEYAGQESSLEDYIRSLYPEDKLIIRWYRNNHTKDWRHSCEHDVFPVDDDIILNLTNDDHFFTDSSSKTLSSLLKHLKECQDPYSQIVYSHHAEEIRMACKANFALLEDGSGFVGQGRSVQSIDICKKERWRHYWFDHDFGNLNVFRPDDHLERHGILSKGNTQFIPIKEQSCHYDGYDHAGQFENLVPSVEIPEGFFENNIRIAYGYDHNIPGYTNIDASRPTLRYYDGIGADYKFCLEDIPMVWNGRISEININPNADLEKLKKDRDNFLYDRAMRPVYGTPHIYPLHNPYPKELFKKEFLIQE